MSLSRKEEIFIESYLTSFSATKAAKDAGYSKKTAGKQGYVVKNRPHVKEEIESRMEERKASISIPEEIVLEELQKLLFLDPEKVKNLRFSDKIKAAEVLFKYGYGKDMHVFPVQKNMQGFIEALSEHTQEAWKEEEPEDG